MISLNDLYSLLIQGSKTYPTSPKLCHRPQAFSAIASLSEIAGDSNGKTICDKDRPYFWSRQWNAKGNKADSITFEYPLIAAFELNATIEGIFKDDFNITYNVQIICVDQYKQDQAKGQACTTCDSRTKNDIYNDTERVLHNVLKRLKDAKYVSLNGGSYQWLLQSIIDDYTAANPGDTTDINIAATNQFKQWLQGSGINQIRYESQTQANLYGTAVTIQFKASQCGDPGDDCGCDPDMTGEITPGYPFTHPKVNC